MQGILRGVIVIALAAALFLGSVAAIPMAWAHVSTAQGGGAVGTVAAPTHEGDDAPLWPFAVGTIIAVGAGALWATRRKP